MAKILVVERAMWLELAFLQLFNLHMYKLVECKSETKGSSCAETEQNIPK